jgi:hypothetical protein
LMSGAIAGDKARRLIHGRSAPFAQWSASCRGWGDF